MSRARPVIPFVVLLWSITLLPYGGGPEAATKKATGHPGTAMPASAPASAAPARDGSRPIGPKLRELTDEETRLEMKGIGERVSDLKEDIFRAKARLVLFNETILGTGSHSGEARLLHRNEMGPTFLLEKAMYMLDDKVVFEKGDASGALDAVDELVIWEGTVGRGLHRVEVELVFRGRGIGIFSYLNKYQFKVKSTYTFSGTSGKLTIVRVIGHEKTVETIEERPSVRYEIEVTDKPEPAKPAPKKGEPE